MLKSERTNPRLIARIRTRRRGRQGRTVPALLIPALALSGFVIVDPVPPASSAAVAAHAVEESVFPTVVGEVRVGKVVTATPGEWQPTPTQITYTWFSDHQAVTGESNTPEYKVRPEDFGKSLSVFVRVQRPGHSTVGRNSDPYPVLPGVLTPPINYAFPFVPKVGAKTTVWTDGVWVPSEGVNLNYRWYYDGKLMEPVEAYDSPSHWVRPDGEGKVLSVEVIGSKLGYDWKHVTVVGGKIAAPDVPFVKSPLPTIAKVQQPAGAYLSARAGVWDPVPERLFYQWFRDGKVIDRAQFDHYRLTAADAGKSFRVEVTGTLTGYIEARRTSASFVVPGATPVVRRLSATPKPRISGTVRVGKKLSVRAGSWKPARVSLSYRWLRNGKAIKGATKSKYRLTSKDRGKRISVRATGKKPGYVTVVKASSAKRVR